MMGNQRDEERFWRGNVKKEVLKKLVLVMKRWITEGGYEKDKYSCR
jgi:hypothetical protein